MAVLITGAESFIGKILIKSCKNSNIETVGIDLISKSSETFVADIRDPAIADILPDTIDCIVHLAAISRDQDCRQDPHHAFDVNVQGTLNLLRLAKLRNVKQIVFASSEWVYGEVEGQDAQTEDQPIDATRMLSHYALSKLVGEQCLRMACPTDVPSVTVLRFGIVYGPRMENWSAVEALVQAVRTRDEVTVGSLSTARRFIHVNDIAAGIIASIGRTGFEIFNLSGSAIVTLGDVIATAREVTGRNPTVTEGNPDAPSIRNPDNAKALSNLNWRPGISLKAGITDVVEHLNAAD